MMSGKFQSQADSDISNRVTDPSRKFVPPFFQTMRCLTQRCIASLPSSLRQMSRVLAVPAHRRPLNSAQAAPMENEDVPELSKRSRVAAAREQLKQDSRTLNDFLGLPSEEAAAAGSCSSSATSPETVSRDEEMHRSVLG